MNSKVIIQGALSLAVKRYLGPFWYRRHWLNKTQWLSPEELLKIQMMRLRKILIHSYNTIPYYHKRMDQYRFNPEIVSLEEMQKLPILTKRDILDAGDELVSSSCIKRTSSTGITGGTTGTPLRIRRDFFSIGTEHAFVRRQWDWAGLKLRDRTAYLSGRPIVPPDRSTGTLYAYDPFMKELILSNYHLSPANAVQFAEAIENYKISAIVGYASSIFYFAQLCEELGYRIRLRAALTTSETINDHMRTTIERIFDCKVFDFYGAAERVCYIFTCEQGSYHIQPEYGLTELIPQTNELAGTFKIVATGFWNFATPLIRYDTGDLVEVSDSRCACGRAFQTVKQICGRTGDFIVTPSGKKFAPTLMARVSKMARNIQQTQIIQDRIDHLWVTYIPNSRFSQDDFQEFCRNMRSLLPSELHIDFKEIQSAVKTMSGKTNLIISKL